MKIDVKQQTQPIKRKLKAGLRRLTRSGARRAARGGQSLICHCGAHKTGSSLIQEFAYSRQAELKQQGLFFHSRRDVRPYFIWGQQDVDRDKKLIRYLRDSYDIHDVAACAFSNENIFGRPIIPAGASLYPKYPETVAALARCLETFDARIVFYIRPQSGFLVSYYLQMIHQGGHLTFDEYVAPLDLEKLSWLPLLEALRDAFGEDRILIGDFRMIELGQETFLRRFFENALPAGITTSYEHQKVHNASLSARGLEIALRINPLLVPGETRKVRRFLQEHFSNTNQPRPLLMSDQLKAELDDRYSREYEDILKSFRTI